MDKILRGTLYFTVIGIISIVIFIAFDSIGSSEKEKKNMENSKLVEPGMELQEMLQIMGPADTIFDGNKGFPHNAMIYCYENAPLASDWINISVGQDSLVIQVFNQIERF